MDHGSQGPTVPGYPALQPHLPDLSPPTYSAPVTVASLLSLNHAKHTPASGLCICYFFSLEHSSQISVWFTPPSLRVSAQMSSHRMTTLHKLALPYFYPCCILYLFTYLCYPPEHSTCCLFSLFIYSLALIRMSLMRAEFCLSLLCPQHLEQRLAHSQHTINTRGFINK